MGLEVLIDVSKETLFKQVRPFHRSVINLSIMSQLLGRQDCIKSLRNDLVDIQGAILNVSSRTGPVSFNSWKFPDKLACNLDMFALLKDYDYVDGEEAFNQHSHIVLLELMIDRLLLLLQSVSVYSEVQRGRQRREQTQYTRCTSVGLVVRNYCANLLQLGNKKEFSKEQTESKTFNGNKTKMGSSTLPITNSSTELSSQCASASSSASSFKMVQQNNTSKAEQQNVSCQTTNSSLIPCSACHQVQSLLRNTGNAFIDLLQSEGLPSSLQPLSAAMEDIVDVGHMTSGDVTQWANEQVRDMRRLKKHLQDVRDTVQPLKERLATTETERDRFRSQLDRAQKEYKQELEKHQINIVQLEFSLQKVQRSSKETEQRLQKEQQQLKKENMSLDESNNRLKEKVAQQHDALQEVEIERSALHEKVKKLQIEEEASYTLKEQIQKLEAQLSDTQFLLDKEKAKYRSACCQQESMLAKQKSLLERVDALDEECEELQRQLGENEEAQITLHNQLVKEQQDQLTQQQNLFEELQKEKQTLEAHVDELKKNEATLKEQVEALKERERLLVAFPELNWTQAQPQSTGDLLLDMEQQLQANSIRVNIMEQENATLHKSLEVLRKRGQHNGLRKASQLQT